MTLTLLLVLFIAVYHRVQFTLPVPMHPSTIFHITCTYHSEKWGDTDKKKASKALSLFNKVRQTVNMWVPPPPFLINISAFLYHTFLLCALFRNYSTSLLHDLLLWIFFKIFVKLLYCLFEIYTSQSLKPLLWQYQ